MKSLEKLLKFRWLHLIEWFVNMFLVSTRLTPTLNSRGLSLRSEISPDDQCSGLTCGDLSLSARVQRFNMGSGFSNSGLVLTAGVWYYQQGSVRSDRQGSGLASRGLAREQGWITWLSPLHITPGAWPRAISGQWHLVTRVMTLPHSLVYKKFFFKPKGVLFLEIICLILRCI